MNILVTGSEGYIGPVVVRTLREAGHHVLGLDALWFGKHSNADVLVVADLRDRVINEKWADNLDVVVHLAGLSNDPMGELSPALTHEINAWGTLDLISALADTRHVVISSCAVYGQASDPCSEDAEPNPQSVYARAKAQVDKWLTDRDRLPIDWVSLRLGTVYGMAPNHRLDLVVNRMVYDALTNRGVTASGDAARPLVHVDDVASAVKWAAEGDVRGIYNVIGENVRIRSLARAIARATDVPVATVDPTADTRDYMASGSKALVAGWHPTKTVEGALPRMIAETGARAFNLPDHVRLTQLRALGLDHRLRRVA